LEKFLASWQPSAKLNCGKTCCQVIAGAARLIVEFACPGDSYGEITEFIDRHRATGTPLVWLINPLNRTVTIYRPDAEPELVNVNQELGGEPHLPRFRVKVAELFA
jgi:Uma2 family endonuclease